ncbi:MAG: DUF4178 domain-containing protein [Planctomycetota bacterium]
MRCTHCGADVEVASALSLVVTCGHCNTLLLRTDVEPEDLGRVALPVQLATRFQRGTEGTYNGVPFTVRGRLQLDHGAGPWNEWAAERADGEWLWIAEAQGELYVFGEAPLTGEAADAARGAAARFPRDLEALHESDLRAGAQLRLGTQTWLVCEVGRGTVLTCDGELPVRPPVGTQTRYVDLGRGERSVATLDLTRAEPELLTGKRVTVDELGLDPATQPEAAATRIEAIRVRCPECDGELVIHDPAHALRVACEHCHAILAPEDGRGAAGAETPPPRRRKGGGVQGLMAGAPKAGPAAGAPKGSAAAGQRLFALLEAQAKVQPRSPIALGTQGTLRGESVTVIGAMQRRVRAGGTWYPWRELLLRRDDGGYWWLVESAGHWALARPIAPAAIEATAAEARLGQVTFRHFTGGKAEVHWVLGEFYWRVGSGDMSTVADYVDPKRARGVSVERTPTELACTSLEHLAGSEVSAAFDLNGALPEPVGVGMLQPNPSRPREAWNVALATLCALIMLRVVFGAMHANEVVYDQDLGPAPATTDAETIDLTEPFELRQARANVRIELTSPGIAQGWLGLTGALVDERTGVVTTFATEAQRYSGVSGGESWSEGRGKGTTLVGSVPSGLYRMRLAVQGYDSGLGRNYHVRVTSQVPRTLWAFLMSLPVALFALVATIRWARFEALRWRDSDHPWGESE